MTVTEEYTETCKVSHDERGKEVHSTSIQSSVYSALLRLRKKSSGQSDALKSIRIDNCKCKSSRQKLLQI